MHKKHLAFPGNSSATTQHPLDNQQFQQAAQQQQSAFPSADQSQSWYHPFNYGASYQHGSGLQQQLPASHLYSQNLPTQAFFPAELQAAQTESTNILGHSSTAAGFGIGHEHGIAPSNKGKRAHRSPTPSSSSSAGGGVSLSISLRQPGQSRRYKFTV